MDKKAYLLSSLKKQVLHLKTQLDQIQKQKKSDRYHHRSTTQSSRFNSSTYDSSYLDKGVKKFPLQDKCKNIIQKTPKLSPFRKAQQQKTKQNFSNQKKNFQTQRKLSPNPLTGIGYSEKKKGIKTLFPEKQAPKQQKRQSNKRHFSHQFY